MNGKGENAMDEREGSTRAVGRLPPGSIGGNTPPRQSSGFRGVRTLQILRQAENL